MRITRHLAATVALIVLLFSGSQGADPSPEQRAVLTTFREEFISLTPGQGQFPALIRLEANPPAAPREITFNYSFHLGRYEVPQNLWEQVMGKNPSRWPGKRNSVEMISLAEAREFCQQATRLMRAARLIAADEIIRLPTEAEWEYAARAGSTTRWSFGDAADKLGEYAWFQGNAAGNDPPVGAKKPNAWGFYDLHGYVWEWCQSDGETSDPAAASQGPSLPPAPAAEPQGVARGGSWKSPAERTTSTARWELPAATRDDSLGLRCVMANEKRPADGRP